MNNAQKQVTQAQLNREKQAIKKLKAVYTQALKDCEQKIRELSERTDMENLQSIIYQKQYQEVLKAQLEGVLANLQSNSYATVSDYLAKCYRDGYTGVMYNLQQTGIPIIMPIDQEAVTKAIQLDSKLSKPLYDKMGEDVTYLKKAVRAEVSRGIANGSTWNEVAGKLARHMANTPFQKAYNNSIRIARTEGHRIQNASALDAMHAAKSKGADIVKQWDSTLDGRTRDNHGLLDGQIREIDEPFEVGGKMADAPGMFGDPAEDCNCRCCLLQRARWALDDEELETLRERAEYFGLDKTTDFEEYQTKYFKVSFEIEHEKDVENIIDDGTIKSGAISGARNPFGEKAQKHAETYYGLVRSMTTDVAKISKATGISEKEIQDIKNYIFLEKHDLGGEEKEYFAPDYMMAESWQRLMSGKPEKHDITLLKHEIMEKDLMQSGMSQEMAHIETSKVYNYSKEAGEFYAKIKKYKKE